MSQLFSKKVIKIYCVLIGVFLSGSNLFAQRDSIPDTDFLKHCKNSDAYYLYSYADISYSNRWSGYKRLVSISNKLVVNNNLGVDKFAFLNLSKFISNNLIEIKIKTLKTDGSVIELDSSLVFKSKSNNRRFDAIRYPIPGVEPGDTIAMSYVYKEYIDDTGLKDLVSLHTDIPSLNTEYTVRSSPDLKLRYKSYNEFPKPQIVLNDTLLYCVFKMENIKGISQNQNTCLACELPYLYYTLEKEGAKIKSWKGIYNQEFNVITQPIAFDYEKSSYYRKWKRKVIGAAKDSTKYYKFRLLHDDILKNIEMEPMKKSEFIKSNGYFLKEKRFNPHSIRRLYRQLLEDLEIEYWAVFAKNKRAGNIDPFFIRSGEFDHVFYAFRDEMRPFNLLYPHEAHYKYRINELPTSIYNTEAIIVRPFSKEKIKKKDKFIGFDFKLAEVDSVEVLSIKLPEMRNSNLVRQIIYGDVNIKEKKTTVKYKFHATGGLSTNIRSYFNMLDNNEEASDFYEALSKFEGNDSAVIIDTITSTSLINKKPFTYVVNANGTLNGVLTFLNDSMISVSLEKLIDHSQVESDNDVADMDYYLDYDYVDHFMMILNFPCNIEVLGFDDSNINFKNNIGAYLFDITVRNNKVTIQSNYKILKDKILKEEYSQLKKINELVNTIKNKRLIIKLKGD